MRLIHKVPFSTHEIETYRHLVFNNLTHGMKYILDAMEDMELKILEENIPHVDLIENASDIRDGEPFPMSYYEPLKSLWDDPNIQKAYQRGNEAALPDKSVSPLISRLSTHRSRVQPDLLFRLAGPPFQPRLRANSTGYCPCPGTDHWHYGDNVPTG
jgi:hypothetical protein